MGHKIMNRMLQIYPNVAQDIEAALTQLLLGGKMPGLPYAYLPQIPYLISCNTWLWCRFMEEEHIWALRNRKRNTYSPNYSSNAKLWFLQNFKLDIGRKVHITDILELYESQKGSNKFSLNKRTVCHIVRDVYGECVEIENSRNGESERPIKVHKKQC
ncbi:hypothetical protein ACROYT_G015033 [Oculina patagonica]